jgi:hypothetical protein
MRKLVCTLVLTALAGCGGDSNSTADAGSPDAKTLALGDSAKIMAYLEGKTLKMDGTNIPPYPNGFNEDKNLGPASQCYISTTIGVAGGQFNVTSVLGKITGAPNVGDVGTCDHTMNGGQAQFTSTNILIENVKNNAACFDITVTYTGFAQEGRAKISPDGKTVTMELYFANQATGHRCAAGDVGAQTVTLNSAAFTQNAQQVYVVQ